MVMGVVALAVAREVAVRVDYWMTLAQWREMWMRMRRIRG
jgi:hypothetical protein